MNKNLPTNSDDLLEQAIAATQETHLPETPNTDELLKKIPTQDIAGTTYPATARAYTRTNRGLATNVMKFLAAAILLITTATFLLNSPNHSAVAEVIANARSNRIIRCQLDTLAKVKFKVHADREAEYVEARSKEIVYFDLTAPRFRIERSERTLNETVDSHWIVVKDNISDRVLVTSSLKLAVSENDTNDADQLKGIALFRESGAEGKVARIYSTSDKGVRPFLHDKTDRTLLELLDELQAKGNIDTTSDEINGRQADKFVFEDGKQTITLWADSQTRLPVRVEEERRNPYRDAKWYKWTYTDFQWEVDNIELDKLFSTEPPSGYAVEDHISNP